MMDMLWAGMILIGVLFSAINGNLDVLTKETLSSAGEAVSVCITMLGVMGLWMGLMNVAKKAGLLDKLTKGLGPVVSFLFPYIPKEHPARIHISTNLVANILGLGWACTPAGLKAMEALAQLETDRRMKGTGARAQKEGTASDEMCDFLILNISSLQLIPVNMIAYRMQYGSVNPTAIIVPAVAATFLSTLTAVVFMTLRRGRRAARG